MRSCTLTSTSEHAQYVYIHIGTAFRLCVLGTDGYSGALERQRGQRDSEEDTEESGVSNMVRSNTLFAACSYMYMCTYTLQYLPSLRSLEMLSDPHNTQCGHPFCK